MSFTSFKNEIVKKYKEVFKSILENDENISISDLFNYDEIKQLENICKSNLDIINDDIFNLLSSPLGFYNFEDKEEIIYSIYLKIIESAIFENDFDFEYFLNKAISYSN